VDVADLIKSFIKHIPDGLVEFIKYLIVPFATSYQQYIAAHALTGNPNYLSTRNSVNWDVSKDDGTTIDNALQAGLLPNSGNPFFSVRSDGETTATICDFWSNVAQEIGKLDVGATNSEDHMDGHDKPLNLQVQDPRKETWAMEDL
jgi:hypothetical protein